MDVNEGSHSENSPIVEKVLNEGAMTLVQMRQEDEIAPYVGKTFKSIEEVEIFYFTYAEQIGFST